MFCLLKVPHLECRIPFTSSGEGLEREERGMEEMGMTDLQFKSFLKRLVADLEEAKEKSKEPEVIEKLDEMIQSFKSDIES